MPVSVAKYPIKRANELVEEYMLLANYLVAEKQLETVGERAVIRRHPVPSSDALAQVVEKLAAHGFSIDASYYPSASAVAKLGV